MVTRVDADARRDRAEARDPRPQLPPRPQQEHRGVQAHRRQGGLRQGRRRHDEAAAAHGARQAQVSAARRAPARRSPTRFRLRVLARKFGKRFTKTSRSPDRRPRAAADAGDAAARGRPTATATATASRTASTPTTTTICSPTRTELALQDRPCKADTDGDGVDGRLRDTSRRSDLNDDEYQIAQTVLPYPEKRPYPNAAVRGRRTSTTTATR